MKEIIKKPEVPVHAIVLDSAVLPLTMYYAFLPSVDMGAYVYVLDVREDNGIYYIFRRVDSYKICYSGANLRILIGDALNHGQVFVFDNFIEYERFVLAHINK